MRYGHRFLLATAAVALICLPLGIGPVSFVETAEAQGPGFAGKGLGRVFGGPFGGVPPAGGPGRGGPAFGAGPGVGQGAAPVFRQAGPPWGFNGAGSHSRGLPHNGWQIPGQGSETARAAVNPYTTGVAKAQDVLRTTPAHPRAHQALTGVGAGGFGAHRHGAFEPLRDETAAGVLHGLPRTFGAAGR